MLNKTTHIKILKEVHTPVLDGRYFISYNDVIQFVTLEENVGLFQHVMVHPFQHEVGVWSIKTYVFK